MKYLALIILFFGVSCKHPIPQKPASVWTDEVLIKVLTDIEIADAALTQISISDSSRNTKGKAYYKQVFDKYQVNAEAFQTTMDWYAAHPRNLSIVYAAVIDSLSKRQSEVANN
jgi:hypothetical protein